jgi:hypothetical protein
MVTTGPDLPIDFNRTAQKSRAGKSSLVPAVPIRLGPSPSSWDLTSLTFSALCKLRKKGDVMTSLSTERMFRRNQKLIGANIDDELIMMSVEHGQYYGLGGIAPRVWELLETPHSLDQLVAHILEEFEVERGVCEQDMTQFLEQMEQLGLVERA